MNCSLKIIQFFCAKKPAKWALLHLLFIHNYKGRRLIGSYCIYRKSEQCGPRAECGVIRVVTECLSSGNCR